MLTRQTGNEFLIRIRLRPAQLVVEMNDGENNPQLVPQLQQHSQERHGIDAAGNSHAHAIPSPQQFLPPDVGEHALSQGMHGTMVAQGSCRDRRPRPSGWASPAENAAVLFRPGFMLSCRQHETLFRAVDGF